MMNSERDAKRSADEQAARWLTKQQAGLSASQQREFAEWLSLSENANRYRFMQQLWQQVGDLPKDSVTLLRASIPATPRKTVSHLIWHKACVATVLCLVLLWPAWQWLSPPLMTTQLHTSPGGSQQFTLPDGTVLSLDADTQLQVAYYQQRREVRLSKGQVYFQVKHLQDKPFVVLSGPSRVTVLGTSFSVRYIPQSMSGDGVEVAVRSGSVRIGARSWLQNMRWRALASLNLMAYDHHLMVLHATQRATGDAHGNLTRQLPIALDNIAEWRQARINFNNTPLNLALAEFSRYGNVPFHLASSDVANLRISGSFNIYRPDSFVDALPKVLPVKLIPQGNETQIIIR